MDGLDGRTLDPVDPYSVLANVRGAGDPVFEVTSPQGQT